MFEFPEGIGPVECVNVEHEEVLLVPRWVKCRRVTFKYGLGDEFINVLKTIKMLGLDNRFPIDVKGVKVAPRDVVAACLPDPAHLGDQMFGKTCAGTWVKGTKDGKPRQVYLYQVADNETCMKKYGVQAVVWQTAVSPVIAWELLQTGVWKGDGGAGPGGLRSRSVHGLDARVRLPLGSEGDDGLKCAGCRDASVCSSARMSRLFATLPGRWGSCCSMKAGYIG